MIALTVRVRRGAAESVLTALVDLVPAGLEERDAGDFTDFVLYGRPEELPSEATLASVLGPALVAVDRESIADDWSERWKRWHQPVDVVAAGRRVRVRPPWEAPIDGDGIDLVVDPGQAFGTGGHDTTRLCLELLLEREPGGGIADWGCGSGVLALAAARLGYSPVVAVDFDPAALEATRDNAVANGITGIEVAHADLGRAPGPQADTVVANLIRPLLLEVADRLRSAPRVLIASGLLRDEADEVAAAFASRGLHETGRRSGGDWSALVLEST